MGRRTVWKRALGRRPRRSACIPVRGALTGALLCAAVLLPGQGPAMAASSASGGYDFADGASTVTAATDTADAALLAPGRTYRSSLARGGKIYFRVELDADSTSYVPVTAVPPASATVSAGDGIRVSMRDADDGSCSYAAARFGASLSAHPVTASATREAGKALCQGAGTYYVLVERLDASASSGGDTDTDTDAGADAGAEADADAGAWDLEIAPVTEPHLATADASTAPQAWDSASPEPVTGTPRRRDGAAGFAGARSLAPGVWRTDAGPGRTLFYAVPVDWGQQLHASVELSGTGGDGGYVSGALDLSLYNPARGYVDDAAVSYNGVGKAAALDPLPPVEYRNRYAVPGDVSALRFAGTYYLVVHVSAHMAETFGQGPFRLTLRVSVRGTPHGAPAYAGRSEPTGLFEVTAQDRQDALTGRSGDGGAGRTTMKVLAAAGLGAGTALLVGLGTWTVVARRRAAAGAAAQTRVSAQKPTA